MMRGQRPKAKGHRPRPNLLTDRRGQAMVEMALILPILILLVMGIVDFGRAYHADLTLTHAAREGARYAVVGAADSEVITRIKQAAPTLDPTKVIVTITPAPSLRRAGDAVTISVNYKLDLVTPVIGKLIGSPLTLKAQTVMRIE